MKSSVAKWMRQSAVSFLRKVGLREGDVVLDFGCNKGNYTVPAARLVGETGKVYALDKNEGALRQLTQTLNRQGLTNAEVLCASSDSEMPLKPASADVALLYDVFHRGYFPDAVQRERLLRRIFAVLKPGGLLSCYPTHLRKFHMTLGCVLQEIHAAGFLLDGSARRTLVHDDELVRGRIFTFRKPSRNKPLHQTVTEHGIGEPDAELC